MGNDQAKVIKQQEEMIRDLQQQNLKILALLNHVYEKLDFEKGERQTVTIGGRKYEFKEKLGQGAFGIVYKANYNGKVYAIKAVEVSEENAESILAELKFIVYIREAFSSRVLPIITVYGAEVIDKKNLYYAMELAEMSLADFYESIANNAQKSELSVVIYLFVLRALLFLESIGIVHSDIKPENFVLIADSSFQTKWNIKLIDFGTVKRLEVQKSKLMTASIGCTPAYVAPEAYQSMIHKKSDIWSLGIMLYRLIFNDFPKYVNEGNMQAFSESKNELELPKCPPKYEYLYYIVAKCLKKNINDRSSASELYEITFKHLPDICKTIIPDPYINDVNVKTIRDSVQLMKAKLASSTASAGQPNNAQSNQFKTLTSKRLIITPKKD